MNESNKQCLRVCIVCFGRLSIEVNVIEEYFGLGVIVGGGFPLARLLLAALLVCQVRVIVREYSRLCQVRVIVVEYFLLCQVRIIVGKFSDMLSKGYFMSVSLRSAAFVAVAIIQQCQVLIMINRIKETEFFVFFQVLLEFL